MKNIYFDIETAPLPSTDIANLEPVFEAPSNYKDAEKIKANIEAQKAAWLEKAALSPLTGSVCAIGLIMPDIPKPVLMFADDTIGESAVLEMFWEQFRLHSERSRFIGFNIFKFDLSFMVRRSWKLGVRIPLGLRNGRYFNDANFVDLLDVWGLGNREERISLDQLAKYLGVGAKSGSGADFHKLPLEEKIKYLTHDLNLTALCAEKLL